MAPPSIGDKIMDFFLDFLKVLFIGVAIASPLLILDVFVRWFPFGTTKKD